MSSSSLHYLFITWPGAGNQYPAIAMAQQLIKNGHRCTFAGYEVQRPLFQERNIPFLLLQKSNDIFAREFAAMGHPPTFAPYVFGCWVCSAHMEDSETIIQQVQPDKIVIDCLQFGFLAAMEKKGSPLSDKCYVYVHSAPGALIPPGQQIDGMFLKPVNGLRSAVGLSPVTECWDAWLWAKGRVLVVSIPELDPLYEQLPKDVYTWIGPQVEEKPRSGWVNPWTSTGNNDGTRPLILVSFSSSGHWDQFDRMRKCMEAMSDTKKYRAIITYSETRLEALKDTENVKLVKSVPHTEILPETSLVITHGGHGTVSTALKYGVPVLILPNMGGADQPLLAKQIQHLNAGVGLHGEEDSVEQIRHAIDHCLQDPQVKKNAESLQQSIEQILAQPIPY